MSDTYESADKNNSSETVPLMKMNEARSVAEKKSKQIESSSYVRDSANSWNTKMSISNALEFLTHVMFWSCNDKLLPPYVTSGLT